MQTSDEKEKYRESLTEKIKELETLLASKKQARESVPVLNESPPGEKTDQGDIPILDELVTSDEYSGDAVEHTDIRGLTDEQLKQLIDNIEHKLTGELESLVQTLKSTVKESILDELKTTLEEPADTPDNHVQQEK